MSRQPGKKSVRSLCTPRRTLLSQSEGRRAVIIPRSERSEILGFLVGILDGRITGVFRSLVTTVLLIAWNVIAVVINVLFGLLQLFE